MADFILYRILHEVSIPLLLVFKNGFAFHELNTIMCKCLMKYQLMLVYLNT